MIDEVVRARIGLRSQRGRRPCPPIVVRCDCFRDRCEPGLREALHHEIDVRRPSVRTERPGRLVTPDTPSRFPYKTSGTPDSGLMARSRSSCGHVRPRQRGGWHDRGRAPYAVCGHPRGAWRSLVARLLWEQEVLGSNPGARYGARRRDIATRDVAAGMQPAARPRPPRPVRSRGLSARPGADLAPVAQLDRAADFYSAGPGSNPGGGALRWSTCSAARARAGPRPASARGRASSGCPGALRGGGSSPAVVRRAVQYIPFTRGGRSSVGRAPDVGSGGRGFKPRRSHPHAKALHCGPSSFQGSLRCGVAQAAHERVRRRRRS